MVTCIQDILISLFWWSEESGIELHVSHSRAQDSIQSRALVLTHLEVKDLPAQHCGKTHTAACWTDIYFLSREYGGDTSMLRPKVQVLLRGWDCYDCWTRILLRHSALPVVACILQSGWVLCTACLWVSDSLAPCSLQLTPQEHSCLYLYLLFSFSLGSTFETKFALRSRGWCGSLSGSALTGKGTIIHILSKTQWNSWMFSRQLPRLITLIWV